MFNTFVISVKYLLIYSTNIYTVLGSPGYTGKQHPPKIPALTEPTFYLESLLDCNALKARAVCVLAGHLAIRTIVWQVFNQHLPNK